MDRYLPYSSPSSDSFPLIPCLQVNMSRVASTPPLPPPPPALPTSSLSLPTPTTSPYVAECSSRAMALYALSAAQGYAESFLRLGDYYYYGVAIAKNKILAAGYYQQAANLKNTQAIFNLGLMHEAGMSPPSASQTLCADISPPPGDGVRKDYHLAKRYYDQAAEIDNKARLPRDLALFLLSSHRMISSILPEGAFADLPELIIQIDEWTQTWIDWFASQCTIWLGEQEHRAVALSKGQYSYSRFRALLTRLHQMTLKFMEELTDWIDGVDAKLEKKLELSPSEEVALLTCLLLLLILLLGVRFYT